MRRTLMYAAISLPRQKAGKDEGNPALAGLMGLFVRPTSRLTPTPSGRVPGFSNLLIGPGHLEK